MTFYSRYTTSDETVIRIFDVLAIVSWVPTIQIIHSIIKMPSGIAIGRILAHSLM